MTMADGPQSPPQEPPAAAAYRTVMELTVSVFRFAALSGLDEIGGLAELAGGPLAIGELAGRCGADPAMLARVLRSVATTGLIRTASPGAYELTDTGRALLDSSALPGLRFNADPEIWTALREIPDALHAGQPPIMARHGSLYEYLASRPETATAFYALMAGDFGPVAAALPKAIDFSAARTVVDVGGGQGGFVTAILRAYPGLRAILTDLDHALPEARDHLAANGVAGRCELVAGDFFRDPLPPGADSYLLAHILHNWSDAQSEDILRAVRVAIAENGQVLIVGLVLPDDDAPHWAKDLDIRLLSFLQGGQRTEPEYAALLAKAGFRLQSVTHLHKDEYVIVGVPA